MSKYQVIKQLGLRKQKYKAAFFSSHAQNWFTPPHINSLSLINWPYEVLNISPKSTPTEISLAFYNEGVKIHPDFAIAPTATAVPTPVNMSSSDKFSMINRMDKERREASFHDLCSAYLELEKRNAIGFGESYSRRRFCGNSGKYVAYVDEIDSGDEIESSTENASLRKTILFEEDWLDKRLAKGKYSKNKNALTTTCLREDIRARFAQEQSYVLKSKEDNNVWFQNLKQENVLSALYNDYIDELTTEVSGVVSEVKEKRSLRPMWPFLKHRPSLAVSVVVVPAVFFIPLRSPIVFVGFLQVGGLLHRSFMYVKSQYEGVVSKPGLLGVLLKGLSEMSYNMTVAALRFLLTKVFQIPPEPAEFLWKEFVDAKKFNETATAQSILKK